MSDKTHKQFDGIPVTLYDGKFSGSFDLSTDVGESINYDDVVCFIVTAVVSKANINTNRMGDVKRTNTFQVTDVIPLEPEQASKFIANINEQTDPSPVEIEGQMSLEEVLEQDISDDQEDAEPLQDDVFVPEPSSVGSDFGYKDPHLQRFLETV